MADSSAEEGPAPGECASALREQDSAQRSRGFKKESHLAQDRTEKRLPDPMQKRKGRRKKIEGMEEWGLDEIF